MRLKKKTKRDLPISPLKSGQDEKVLEKLGATVHRLRKCAGISQVEIGKILSLHQAAVCRIEAGLQSLQPWQLQQLATLYDVRVTALLNDELNYWQVAERFNRKPPFPEQYLKMPFAKVREFLPLLRFVSIEKGPAFCERLLNKFGLEGAYLRGPDQPMGVNCNLDLVRESLKLGLLNDRTLGTIVDEARSESVQGFLHPLFQTQVSPTNVLKTLVMNAHHYESNFKYEIAEQTADGLVVTVAPADHMRYVTYRDEELTDILCRYKRRYFAGISQYIGAKPLQLQEKECHFHGANRCVYKIKAA